MKKYLVLLGLMLLTGCDEPPNIRENSDVEVGRVNGKVMRRVVIHDGVNYNYVYYFPDDPRQPISNNTTRGKRKMVVVTDQGQ
jgi:hypothetical protein